MFLRRFTWPALGLLLAAGCAHPVSTAPRITIAPGDPIRTLAQYQRAREQATAALPPGIRDTAGIDHLRACVLELNQLPSAPSRRFARAVVATLRQHGIEVPDPPAGAGTSTMSYQELAQIEALTAALHDWDMGPPRAAPAPALPYELKLDLQGVFAAECPGDYYAFAAGIYVSAADPADHIADRVEWTEHVLQIKGRQARNALARFLEPNRPLNLTTLEFFKAVDDPTTLGMTFLAYAVTLDTPNGHNMRDLAAGLRAAALRARKLDPSPETQASLDAFLRTVDGTAISKQIEIPDYNLKLAQDTKPVMEQFFRALAKNDQPTLQSLLAPALLPQLPTYREKLAASAAQPGFRVFFDPLSGSEKGILRGACLIPNATDATKPGITTAFRVEFARQNSRWIITRLDVP